MVRFEVASAQGRSCSLVQLKRAAPVPAYRVRGRGVARTQAAASTSGEHKQATIMVNSCTGKMGHACAEAVVRAGLELVPRTFCGYSAGVAVRNVAVAGVPVELVGRERRQQVMDEIRAQYPHLVIIDFTMPNCVNENLRFYASNGVPFVVGTTGGNRERLLEDAQRSGCYAIVAPQMAKQLVLFQAMLEYMAATCPGAFAGYTLHALESHQATKVDASGTARVILDAFARLGAKLDKAGLVVVRDPEEQLAMGVPYEHLEGHAWHRYTLTSPDGAVALKFQHDVLGRDVYAEGAVDAALFVARQQRLHASRTLYTMLDVLHAGALR